MTHPTDAELEAEAQKFDMREGWLETGRDAKTAALLRACKSPAPDARQPSGLYSALTAEQQAAAISVAENESFGPEECKNAPDARQEGWNAAIEAAAKVAKSYGCCHVPQEITEEIRALAEKGPDQ